MSTTVDLRTACWPRERLGEALEALAGHRGAEPLPALPPAASGLDALTLWLDESARRLGGELEPVQVAADALDALLDDAGPALLTPADAGGAVLLLLGRGRRGRVRWLAPDGRVRQAPRADLARALRAPFDARHAREVDALLAVAGVPAARRPRARERLLADRSAQEAWPPAWLWRWPPSAPITRQWWAAGVPQRLALALAGFAAVYAGEVMAWSLLGEGVLAGRLDSGWAWAWWLLLMGLLPLRTAAEALDASFARRAGARFKQRLLAGALRMAPDAVRGEGVGHLLGRVLEAQSLEALALGGALTGAVALMEVALAGWVLAQGAAPAWHLALLALALAAAATFGGLQLRGLRGWTAQRLALSHRLIEQMSGHRTRLAQERAERRDAAEDRLLARYHASQLAADRAGLALRGGLPAGWRAAALLALVPALLGGTAATAVAVSLGGVLLAHRGFAMLGGALEQAVRAVVAWRQVGELFRAGARAEAGWRGSVTPVMAAAPAPADGTPGAELFRADDLGAGHAGQPLWQGLDFRLRAGEPVRLEGASGAGKSTLAAVWAGLRPPQHGHLSCGGLDPATLGEAWSARVALAPQFHENHLFAASVADNLLMGRPGPHGEADLADARRLCEALGLGPLIARMPAGMHQRLGETGWQLSHGERSRVFLARALLQRAPVTLLDESFAALDPATLQACLGEARRRCPGLVVIAHP
jgi:ATP-binding cassette subfamily B protein